MSELFPLPRSVREDDFVANGGQTSFGPPAWFLFDAADVLVFVKPDGATIFGQVTDGFTVTPVTALPGQFTIVFDTGLIAGDTVRIKGARSHERLTNVTQAGAIRAVPLETELDRVGVVMQELRRDNDRSVNLLGDAENAAAAAEAAQADSEAAESGSEDARDAAFAWAAVAEAAESGSEDARDAAFAWATEDEDVAVDDGVNPAGFSAFHWSQKALAAAGADVSGPDGDVANGELALFSGTTGKLIDGGGVTPLQLIAGLLNKAAIAAWTDPAAAAEDTGDITLDVNDGDVTFFKRTLVGNETLQIPVDMPNGWTVYFRVDPDSNTLSFAAGFVGAGDELPDVTEDTLLAIVRDGAEYLVVVSGFNFGDGS